MPLHVDGTHVDGAGEPEERRTRRGRHAVLAGAGLRDHPLLAHASCQETLTEHVVDLVRTRVREILALQEHAQAEALRQPCALRDRGRAADIGREQRRVFGPERVVVPGRSELVFELPERGNERLRREAATELAEASQIHRFGPRWLEVHGAAAQRD